MKRWAKNHTRKDPSALIDAIFDALGEQTVTVPGSEASESVVPRHAARIKALKSATEDVATTVAADMTVAGHRLTILKSFNKSSGRCELTVTSPRRENLTGQQFGGDSPADDEAAGAGAAAGTGTADGAGALIGRITEEYLRYFTPGGRPSKELKAVTDALAAAEADHDAATGRYTQAQNLITELEQLTVEKTAVAKQEPVAAEAAVGAEKTLAEGRAAVAELDGLRRTVTAAAGVRDLADQRARARADRISALADAEKTGPGSPPPGRHAWRHCPGDRMPGPGSRTWRTGSPGPPASPTRSVI